MGCRWIDLETAFFKSVLTRNARWTVFIGRRRWWESTPLAQQIVISSSLYPFLLHIIMLMSTVLQTKETIGIDVEKTDAGEIQSGRGDDFLHRTCGSFRRNYRFYHRIPQHHHNKNSKKSIVFFFFSLFF